MKKHKKHVYIDRSLPCDICGRLFVSPQALHGHRRMIHGVQDKTIPDPGIGKDQGSPQETIKNLEGEVKQLKLEKEKRQLVAELPSASAKPLDVMEQIGLGSLEGSSKELAQKRAMGITDQGQAPSWIDKIISNPEALKLAIAGLRGVLGVDGRGNGDNSLKILSDLGFDLKSLIQGANSPKAGALSIAGVSLEGANLTPELLQSILQYKSAEVKAKADFEGRKEMADGLKNVLQLIGKGLGESMAKPAHGRNISQEIMPGSEPPGFQPFVCPKCGAKNELPAEIVPGQEIKCQGEGCDEIWTTVDERAQPKPKRAKKQVEVKPPIVEETACPGCGQLLSLEGRAIGDVVRCSVCSNELTVTSETLAVPAQEPLSESEKAQSQAFLRR